MSFFQIQHRHSQGKHHFSGFGINDTAHPIIIISCDVLDRYSILKSRVPGGIMFTECPLTMVEDLKIAG